MNGLAPSSHLVKAHWEVVRLTRAMQQVDLPNFAAALDSIEQLIRIEIGDDAADANFLTTRERTKQRRASPRRKPCRRRLRKP
jgi:hypothetical protein